MIETLCLAAEVTAVLLMLSMAWERANYRKNAEQSNPTHRPTPPNDGGVFQSLIHLHIECLRAINSFAPPQAMAPLLNRVKSLAMEMPEGYQDHSLMYHRNTLQHVVKCLKQRTLDESFCVAMVDLEEIDKIQTELGLLVAQQLANQLAEQLLRGSSSHAICIRTSPSRAILVFPNAPDEKTLNSMSQLCSNLSEFQWDFDNRKLSSRAIFSLAGFESSCDENSLLDLVEAGLLEARALGAGRCVWMNDHHWAEVESQKLSRLPSDDSPIMSFNDSPNIDSEGGNLDYVQLNVDRDETNPFQETLVAETEVNKKASADDITALFATVRPNAPTQKEDRMGTDEIAAMFASNRVEPTVVSKTPYANNETIDQSMVATNDSANEPEPSVEPAVAGTVGEAQSTLQPSESDRPLTPTPPNTPESDDSAIASLDDIEALLASYKVQPKLQPTPVAD